MMSKVESRVVLTCSSLLVTVQSLSTAWRSRACAMAEGAATADTEREYQDCLACRVTGSATLLGVSAYFFHERGKLPKHDVGQRRWLLACCGAFAIAGVWRATTSRFATAVDGDGKETKQ